MMDGREFRARALLLAALLLACGTAAALPGWRLADLGGNPVGPGDFRGQWVVVNYWATWCKPCREEMPALDAIASENENVTVLGVAWEDTGVEDLRRFLERIPVGYPILRADPFDPPPGLASPRVLPTTVIFGPGGEVAERFHGPVTRSDIQRIVDAGGEP